MNAHDITTIRTTLGLTKNEFSDVLGISPHTLSRWERGPEGIPNIDPMQRRLLLALRIQLDTRAGAEMGPALRDALALGGPLKALYVLLCHVYGTAGGASAASADGAHRREEGA